MSRFQKATAQNLALKVLLIGTEGTAKTRSALTFPKPVVIDTETGTNLFARKFDFDVFQTKSMKEAIDAVNEAMRGPYETIVVDSITSLYNTLVSAGDGRQKDGSLSIKQWGIVKRNCSKLLDALMVKAKQHVVCTAWAKEKYAKPGTIVNGREVGENDLIALGEIADFDKKAGHAFDFVFRMDNLDGYEARVIKARGDLWPTGFSIKIPNGASFYDVFTKALAKEGVTLDGSGARTAETESEAARKDEELFEAEVPTVQDLTELFEEARAYKLVDDPSLGAYIVRTIEGFTQGSRLTAVQSVQVRKSLKQILQTPAA